jgi:septum formation protein
VSQKIVLASASASRRAMLDAAGVPHEAVRPSVDEESAKASLRAEGHGARQLADALAELKALSLSRRLGGAIVIGCDSMLEFEDGTTLDKAVDRADATAQLRQLRGQTHKMISAAVACQNGVPVWRHVDVAKLRMRDVSDAFIETYLDAEGEAVLGCVGCYRLEGLGAQLFDRIDGSHFTILGLPLLPLLGWLRDREVIAR